MWVCEGSMMMESSQRLYTRSYGLVYPCLHKITKLTRWMWLWSKYVEIREETSPMLVVVAPWAYFIDALNNIRQISVWRPWRIDWHIVFGRTPMSSLKETTILESDATWTSARSSTSRSASKVDDKYGASTYPESPCTRKDRFLLPKSQTLHEKLSRIIDSDPSRWKKDCHCSKSLNKSSGSKPHYFFIIKCIKNDRQDRPRSWILIIDAI